MNKISLYDADIIIPYRGSTTEREENLYATLRFFEHTFNDYHIWLLEAAEQPIFDWARVANPNISYLFYANSEPFPKALLNNLGAKVSDKDFLVFCDIDCIPEPLTLSLCVGEMRGQRYDFLCPFTPVINVDAETKQTFIKNLDFEYLREQHKQLSPNMNLLYKSAVGGVVVCRRKDFISVGGFNGEIKGWGGEDNELFSRAGRLGIRWHSVDAPLFHLNHDTSNRYEHLEKHKDNTFLGENSQHMPLDELKALAERLHQFFEN